MDHWQLILWAGLAIALLVSEMATVQLVAIWFGGGCLAAFVSALIGVSFPIQIIIFILVSVVLLISTRPFIKKKLNIKKTATNADRIIGQICIVTETVDNESQTGRVNVDGMGWSARLVEGFSSTTIEVGQRCEVVDIKGVKAIVKPL